MKMKLPDTWKQIKQNHGQLNREIKLLTKSVRSFLVKVAIHQ